MLHHDRHFVRRLGDLQVRLLSSGHPQVDSVKLQYLIAHPYAGTVRQRINDHAVHKDPRLVAPHETDAQRLSLRVND